MRLFLQRFLAPSTVANIRGFKSIAVALCFGITLCLAGIANAQNAQTVTYSWTGTIVGVGGDDGTGTFTGTQVGDTFSGTFTYDPNVGNIAGLSTSDGDSVIEPGDVWVEYHLASSSSAVLSDGTTELIWPGATLSITTDYPLDEQDALDWFDSYYDLFGIELTVGTLADGWGLDFGDGIFEFELSYGSFINMQDDLSFRPNPPWSPPASPDDPDNQIATFEILEYSDYDQEELIYSAFGVVTMAEVQAGYNFELIDYPGTVLNTQVFGINDRGNVVGNGVVDPDTYPFVYASKKGRFTDVAPLAGYSRTAVLGISDSGVMVGSVDNDAFIRDKKGNFTVFSHEDAFTYTQFRGVNNKGLVTGIRDSSDFGGTIYGFIYDPKSDTYTDIIPLSDHDQSLAHGINSAGVVVGSAFFFGADDPCNPGNTGFYQRYGWRRATDGTVTYFSVNGSSRTAARGINDSETIVGLVRDPNDNRRIKGFKVTLDGSQCQEFTLVPRDLLEFPGFDSLYPEGITNSGVIVGGVDEFITSGPPPSHGFIATPDKKGKK